MNIDNKIKKNNVILEIIKWISSASLLVASITANYICCDYDIFIRRMVVFIIITVAMCVLLTTKLGRLLTIFVKEAYIELQKVIWPTYQDTLNTTFVIIAVTVIISLMLWGLDTVLVHLISFGLRL